LPIEQPTPNYNELERLIELSVPDAPQGTSSQDESYTLAPEGNRITSHLSTAHETDKANTLKNFDIEHPLKGNSI